MTILVNLTQQKSHFEIYSTLYTVYAEYYMSSPVGRVEQQAA